MNFSQRKPDYPCALCMEAGRTITKSKHVTADRGHEFKLARVASDKTVIMECRCMTVAEVEDYQPTDAGTYVAELQNLGWHKMDDGWKCGTCYARYRKNLERKEKKREEELKRRAGIA